MSYGTPPPGPGAPMYPPPPNHPSAVTVLVLGVLSLAVCGILGIPAWIMGNRVVREIDASGGALGGRGTAQAGRICGIVGTALLALSILILVGLLVVFVAGTATVETSVG